MVSIVWVIDDLGEDDDDLRGSGQKYLLHKLMVNGFHVDYFIEKHETSVDFRGAGKTQVVFGCRVKGYREHRPIHNCATSSEARKFIEQRNNIDKIGGRE